MFGGGESYVASVEQQQQSNDVFVKLCHSRCVLGRKDTEDGPLSVITPEESGWYHAYVNNFPLEELQTHSRQRSFGIGFVCRQSSVLERLARLAEHDHATAKSQSEYFLHPADKTLFDTFRPLEVAR